MLRRTAVAAATTLALLAATATAQASSIVFIRGGDIWLTTPDGKREYRVTTGGGYDFVTQADDGRIFAVDGGILYGLTRDGRKFLGPRGTGDLLDVDVSPDGSKLAFWYPTSGGPRHAVINADGTLAPEWDDQNGSYPTWIANDLTLESNGAGYLETTHAGKGGWNFWTAKPDGRKHASAMTRAGDRLVAVVRDYDDVGPWSVAHYANTSQAPRTSARVLEPPPEDQQPVLRCVQDFGSVQPDHPRFSPDGTWIAWEIGDGVSVEPAFDLASCSQPPGGFTIAGASSPDWGPAEMPTVRPATARCLVPKLNGKTLAAARKSLKKAGCRLGKVRRVRSKRRAGTVLRQSPGAGKRRSGGARIAVVVARG